MKNESLPIEKEIEIEAPKARVWEVLLEDAFTRQWYAAFSEGTTAKTTWELGSKAVFTDSSGQGIVGQITQNIPLELLAITYNGVVLQGKEDYESEWAQAVKGWQEAYRLTESGGKTRLQIRSDMSEKHLDSMAAAWDKALVKVKTLAESK